MAYLLRKGHVDTVVTEDSDLLVFGCKEVLFKLLPCGTAKRVKLADVFIKVKALEGWTQSMFRHMCILASDNSVPPRIQLCFFLFAWRHSWWYSASLAEHPISVLSRSEDSSSCRA